MKQLIGIILLSLVTQLTAVQEPPEYPNGTYCTPKGDMVGHLQTPDHPCHCKRMYMPPVTNPNGPVDCETGPASHDSSCKQWCHEDHCGCPTNCPIDRSNK